MEPSSVKEAPTGGRCLPFTMTKALAQTSNYNARSRIVGLCCFGRNRDEQPHLMQSRQFRDFDAFSASVRDVDATMMLQNPARRLWTINQVNIGGIDVQLGQVGSGNLVEGQSWQNGTLIYLPLSPRVAYRANGIAFGKNELMVLEPGCEFCLSTQSPHDWCTIFIPKEKRPLDSAPPTPTSAYTISEGARCRVARTNGQVASRFYSIVRGVLMASAHSALFEHSPAAESAADELTGIASLILGKKQAAEPNRLGRPKMNRSAIMQSCRELFEARAGQQISVQALAAKAGASERTLRQAFYDYFGIGPVRYLQLRQLHQIHRALRIAGPDAAHVGDVLAQHGIWEFGRFTSRYRRLFGELPSQTLRAKFS